MEKLLDIKIENQPDLTTCGPTSLRSIYKFYGDDISTAEIVSQISQFEDGGGTFAVILGRHALKRGYRVRIISYNINIFDPTWFHLDMETLKGLLKRRLSLKDNPPKQEHLLKEYISFLTEGGQIEFKELSEGLLQNLISSGTPILTGLSSTWLYQSEREDSSTNEFDPVAGDPAGHFVVINGFKDNIFKICDPYSDNPFIVGHYYEVDVDRLLNSILLGISSFDGNLLLVEKK